MNFIDVIAYLVFIGLGMIFGYMIGYGRDLADIRAEYEMVQTEHFKIVEAWQKEYLKLYEAYRTLQDSINLDDEDVK